MLGGNRRVARRTSRRTSRRMYRRQDAMYGGGGGYDDGYDEPPPAAAEPAVDVTEELTKLAALRDQGILTDAEFDAKKKQILGL